MDPFSPPEEGFRRDPHLTELLQLCGEQVPLGPRVTMCGDVFASLSSKHLKALFASIN